MKVVEAAGSLLSRHGGQVRDIARQVRGALLRPHVEPQRIKRFSGDRRNMDGGQDLVKVANEGVPVGVRTGGTCGSR